MLLWKLRSHILIKFKKLKNLEKMRAGLNAKGAEITVEFEKDTYKFGFYRTYCVQLTSKVPS